ncbi:MAG: tyrosine-type recombinase/integrase [Moorellales bacterium]
MAQSYPAKNSSHNLFAPFLAELQARHASPKTVEAYRADLAGFARWYLETTGEALRPELVTEMDLADWRQHLARRHKPSTVNRKLVTVRKWLGWALEEGLIGRMPRLPKPMRREKLAPKALSRKEQNALLRAVERSGNDRDRAIVYVLLYCGLRVGELVGLNVEDVELRERRGKITVRGKGAKLREVPIPAPARRALADYLGGRTAGPLFLGQRGPLTARGVELMLKKYAYQARIEGLTPHTLRHTCATNLLNSGVDLVKVAAMLGHENLNTTMVYTRPTFEELARAVEREDVSAS